MEYPRLHLIVHMLERLSVLATSPCFDTAGSHIPWALACVRAEHDPVMSHSVV